MVIGIDGLVKLAHVRIDAELAEERFHAEGAGLVGHDGHDVTADVFVAQEVRQQADEGHGAGDLAPFAAGEIFGEIFPFRRLEFNGGRTPAGHKTGQGLAMLAEICISGLSSGGL